MFSKITLSSLLASWLFFAGMGLAAEQDYAARFKELQTQKADAQIDPLLGARKYYEEVVKVDPNGEYAQDAKDALRKLKKK